MVSGSLWGPRRAAPARARQSWRGAGIARSQTLYRRARSPYRRRVALTAAAERLESVVVDGFVRRGGKYFPGCQREMCASLPRALAPVCGAVVSEGMYPGPVARTPEFGVYVN